MPGTCLQFSSKKTKPSWFIPLVSHLQYVFSLKWPSMFSVLLHAKKPDKGNCQHSELFVFFFLGGGGAGAEQGRPGLEVKEG